MNSQFSEQIQSTLPNIPLRSLSTIISCPKCQSRNINKNGTRKNNWKYICKNCRKTFSETTGTAIHCIKKKEQFLQYAHCIKEGMTIRQAAKHIGISVSTSFAWRHKHLSSLPEPKIETLLPVQKAELTITPYSEKGKKNKSSNKKTPTKSILLFDFKGNILLSVTQSTKTLRKLIGKSEIQLTHRKNKFLTHSTRLCNMIKGKPSQIKLNKSQIQKLNLWMNKFHGVATKYLQQYWTWYTHLSNQSISRNTEQIFINNASREKFMKLKPSSDSYRDICISV